jgi:predicted NAD-dependent protein-ADP-ribosyltransferase YbiA (DUF1768 family)
MKMSVQQEIRFNTNDYSYGLIPNSITLPLVNFRTTPIESDAPLSAEKVLISAYEPSMLYALSNMARLDIEIDGNFWKSAEHYIQAQKFVQFPAFAFAISECDTPEKASLLGNLNWLDDASTIINYQTYKMSFFDVVDKAGLYLCPRNDWSYVRHRFMIKAISAKLSQYNFLREALLETGNSPIQLVRSEYDSNEAMNEVISILTSFRDDMLRAKN